MDSSPSDDFMEFEHPSPNEIHE